MLDTYGHSTMSMMRARCKQMHKSNAFQCLIAFVIIFGFGVDIADAQMLPEAASPTAWVFWLLDIIYAIDFTADSFASVCPLFHSRRTHIAPDIITEGGKHLGPEAEFNAQQFQEMMKGELWRFSRRELSNVLSIERGRER